MSIFKTKHWWSSEKFQEGQHEEGIQNQSCIKIDKFNSHSESDCIVVGENSLLKIYKPNKDEKESNIVLEVDLNISILQVETGKFTVNLTDRQVIVLHPQSFSIYELQKKEGHIDVGEQNLLEPVLKHSFTRRAHSLICGPFGNIKTRDFICIQGLDGSLSFFDQDLFLFLFIFDDVIIPGPIAYVASSDCFVICKSTWTIEIHGYHNLREFSELKDNQNKKNIPQWIYNAGEEISSVQVLQTSNNFSTIIALGERYLCAFQDNGLMKYMMKLNYTPVCFHAYLIGWFYEPGARLLVMIASDDSKLYIYEGTRLLWSCDLLHSAISLTRCFLKYLPGGIVTLSENGIVNVSYLGTEPDLNSSSIPALNDNLTPEEVQKELEVVEESLQKIMKEDDPESYTALNKILKIKADVGKPVAKSSLDADKNPEETLSSLMCPVIVVITCEGPQSIQSIQISYASNPPFAFTDSTVCLEDVNGTEIVETQVYVASAGEISDAIVKILFTIIDRTGKLTVLTKEVSLPVSLYCYPIDIVTENAVKLQIQTNHTFTDLTEILTDFLKDDLLQYGNHHTLTFKSRTTHKTVTIRATLDHYLIEADDYTEITCILQYFIMKLSEYFTREMKDFRFSLKCDEEIAKQLTHRFLRNIEVHAKERIQLKIFENELEVLQKQFILIQKKLLIQYGSLPPGDCGPLEFLMRDTHNRLVRTVQRITHYREAVCRAGCNMTAVGKLIVYIFRQNLSNESTVKLVEDTLALDTLYDLNYEWEEAVSQSLAYTLNHILQKSEKDREKLAPATEQDILSQINLRRFLKQMKMLLDNLFLQMKTEMNERMTQAEHKETVPRIEEMVEVI